MSREVPYDKNAICDNCGKAGSYDFIGDTLCEDCLVKTKDTFLSKLTALLIEFEIAALTNTKPETLAKFLEGIIYNYNELKVAVDKPKDDYIKVLESENDDLHKKLRIELDKVR